MENLEIEFDRVFFKYGGSFQIRNTDFSNIGDSVENLYIIIKNFQRTEPSFPTPYVSIINSYDVNAVVLKDNGIYFIGLFYGALLWLTEIFRRILSNPNVLIQVGESKKERLVSKINTAQFRNFEHFVNVVNPQAGSMPKDPLRGELADHLATHAIMFVLLHEYGHIVNGHVDALNSIHSNNNFEERLSNISMNNHTFGESEYILFRQTCEYDADSFANNILLNLVKLRVEGKVTISTKLKFVYENYESAIFYYNFSIYTYWRLFGIDYEFGENLLTRTHPPSGIRQNLTMALIHTIFQPFGMNYADKMSKQCMDSLKAVEEAFNQISEQGYNLLAIATTYQKDHINHREKIIANWENVRPILEPFAHIKLAP